VTTQINSGAMPTFGFFAVSTGFIPYRGARRRGPPDGAQAVIGAVPLKRMLYEQSVDSGPEVDNAVQDRVAQDG
jgi:hypothetical protein